MHAEKRQVSPPPAPSVDRMTDARENITFPILRMRAVKICDIQALTLTPPLMKCEQTLSCRKVFQNILFHLQVNERKSHDRSFYSKKYSSCTTRCLQTMHTSKKMQSGPATGSAAKLVTFLSQKLFKDKLYNSLRCGLVKYAEN